MPKRMLDDSLLTSPSLAQLSPRAQDAFPRFVLLADDFGCFEVVAKVLHAKGWPYRADVTDIEVASWLGEYESVGMLFAWEEGGRMFAYLTGWHGEHGQKARDEYDSKTARHGSKRRTPRPPGFIPAESRFIPARESAGIATLKIPSPFLPARETPVSRPVPATVVPVPVPVAGSTTAVATSATGGGATPGLFADEAEGAAAKSKPPPAADSDPRKREKREAFERIFLEARGAEYRWQGAKDACAVRSLVAVPLDEWERRARVGLTTGEFSRRISSVAQLGMKWNDLAGTAPGKPQAAAPAEPPRSHTRRVEIA